MIRRPPRSTLFPTRRSSDLVKGLFAESLLTAPSVNLPVMPLLLKAVQVWLCVIQNGSLKLRSEEHTSELQSRSDLVCRLLLEKKKLITCGTITDLHRYNVTI